MRRRQVVDPEVEVDLLRRAIGPFGVDMVWSQLDPNPRLTVDEHHVPIVFDIDGPAEHSGPEAALCGEIGGIEHDDLEIDVHGIIVAAPTRPALDRASIAPIRRSGRWRGSA